MNKEALLSTLKWPTSVHGLRSFFSGSAGEDAEVASSSVVPLAFQSWPKLSLKDQGSEAVLPNGGAKAALGWGTLIIHSCVKLIDRR